MEALVLKQEWAVKCDNCGNDSHCSTKLNRTEVGYASEGAKEHDIEVCGHCRCKACAA
jgi:hypothetical protein